MSSTAMLWDASAALAVLQDEPGAERGRELLLEGRSTHAITAVNAVEVLTKLCEKGMPVDDAWASLEAMGLETIEFDAPSALAAASLWPMRKQGLSLGDRACLGAALAGGRPVLTAEQGWPAVAGVRVEKIRLVAPPGSREI